MTKLRELRRMDLVEKIASSTKRSAEGDTEMAMDRHTKRLKREILKWLRKDTLKRLRREILKWLHTDTLKRLRRETLKRLELIMKSIR